MTNQNKNKCSTRFDKRPNDHLVSHRGCEWIRPILTPILYMVPWARMSQPNGIGSVQLFFAQLIRVSNTETNTQTHKPRHVRQFCNNRPPLMHCVQVMRP